MREQLSAGVDIADYDRDPQVGQALPADAADKPSSETMVAPEAAPPQMSWLGRLAEIGQDDDARGRPIIRAFNLASPTS